MSDHECVWDLKVAYTERDTGHICEVYECAECDRAFTLYKRQSQYPQEIGVDG
jgi:hypothetical protein